MTPEEYIKRQKPIPPLEDWTLVHVVCRLMRGVPLNKAQADAIIEELNNCLGGQDGKHKSGKF